MTLELMKQLRKQLSLLTQDELQLVVGDLFLQDEDESDYDFTGHSIKRVDNISALNTEYIDISKELSILNRGKVISSIYLHNDDYYLESQKIRFVEINNKVHLYVGGNLIKGQVKTDILVRLLELEQNVVPLGGDEWYMFRFQNKYIFSFYSDGIFSSIKKYDPKKKYYGELYKIDGSRSNYHSYSSINRRIINRHHEMYGDLGAMFGGNFDQQLEDNYQLAKEIVEEYESRM